MKPHENLLLSWRALVTANPAAPAVIDGATGRVWSRGDITVAASSWTKSLSNAVRAHIPHRRIVMAEPNGPRWFYVFIALLEMGAVPALADSKETPERLLAIAEACKASAIWRDGEITLMCLRKASQNRDELLIKLTSGSTGLPKVLVFKHAQMLADGRQICGTMGIRPDDINLGIIPFGHSYGLGHIVVPLFEQGTPVVCAASPFPHAIAADCARWKPTIFPAVPTLLRTLAIADADPAALASLRLVISAGAPLQATDAIAFAAKYNRRVHNFYGTSETGGISYDHMGGAAEKGSSVGQPLKGVRLTWRPGGRFTVSSAAVHGYGRFSPPDRGEINEAGELVLLGRSGRTLKIAGRRLDPAEIEKALLALPGVREALVVEHPSRPDAIAAAIAADEPLPHTIDIRKQLVSRLAAWKVPDHILVLAAFPITQRGKMDRAALVEMLGAGGRSAATP